MNTILSVGELLRTQDFHWRSSENWELIYCTGGAADFLYEGGLSLHCSQGDVVMIPPGERYLSAGSRDFTNILITMAEPAVPQRSIFRLSDDSDGRLRHAFSEARDFYLADVQKRELVLSALGDLICGYLAVLQSNTEFSEPIQQIRSEILRHYSEPGFALDAVIRAMPFHYDYLRKLFKKEVGVTPREYLTSLRMKKAGQLLSTMRAQNFSMTEVAEKCGYDDALYFSRVFKKYFGCAPTSFYRHSREGKIPLAEEDERA